MRLVYAVLRALMLVLAIVLLAQYMIEHPRPADRPLSSILAPLAILVFREVTIRWEERR
jgi:hypothetical protein